MDANCLQLMDVFPLFDGLWGAKSKEGGAKNCGTRDAMAKIFNNELGAVNSE